MKQPNETPDRPTPDYYEQIIDSLASGVIAFDKEGVITLVNRAAREHLGVAERDLRTGMRINDLLVLKPFADVLREVFTTHTPVSRKEVVLPQADGTRKEIGFSGSLLKGPESFNGAIFLFVDMTERRTLERAAELNRQLAQIGELTAGVVHELRNPLTVITGMAELLQRKIEPDDPRRKALDTIVNEARNLGRSIAQFLGFAKPFELESIPCRPETVVDRTLDLCKPRAVAKQVALTVACDPDLPEIKADPGKLAQAVVNIVNNAIDAVAQHGHVTLHAGRHGADILFEVTDDGPGIVLRPGEDIFKPFFSRKESGTGLGLAIAHRILTAHGGSIAFMNREEGGSCFVIRIPIEKGAPR